MNCPRPISKDGCANCWSQISSHLMNNPSDLILPNPNLCQDAAWVAFVLDKRLEEINKLVGL